jgi:hypothetical protein
MMLLGAGVAACVMTLELPGCSARNAVRADPPALEKDDVAVAALFRNVDAKKNTITFAIVTSHHGRISTTDMTCELAKDVKVLREKDGKQIKLADLKPGMHIAVYLNREQAARREKEGPGDLRLVPLGSYVLRIRVLSSTFRKEDGREFARADFVPAPGSGAVRPGRETMRYDLAAAEKKAFLELLTKLPTEHEGFYTEEAIDKAEPYTRVLLALTEKDIAQYAKGLGVKNYCLYPFSALSAGLLERKGPREYVVKHFGEIAHPELKLGWAAGLFNKNAASPEIVRFLRAALESKEQARELRLMYGPDFKDFKKRLSEAAEQERVVAAIKKLGGEVTVDEQALSKPIAQVDLSGTAITDEQLACLEGLSDLRELDLGRTRITDKGLAHLRGLTSLQTLSLVRAPVSDDGLAHLKGLRNLRSLYLVRTQVTDASLTSLKGLTGLRELTLVRTPVTDAGVAHLQGLTDLRLLNLTGTKVTDRGLAELKKLTKLRTLSVGRTEITDKGLVHLRALPDLRILDLRATGCAGAGLAELARLKKLQVLILDGTGVKDADLSRLKGLTDLRDLHLGGTQVTDAGLGHVKSFTKLMFLTLDNTAVTDAGLVHLEGLKNLRTLSLHGTKVTEPEVERWRERLSGKSIDR